MKTWFNYFKNSIRFKKVIYLSATTILGVFLAFIIHAFIEIIYLNWAEESGQVVYFYCGCTIPLISQILLFVFGAFGGFFLGSFWWKKIYIEKSLVK